MINKLILNKNINIMIVDDIPMNLDILSAMLERHGYKIRPATSGKAALKAIQVYPPDIILLDINMPDMNGIDVCRQLKMNDKLKNIPVIFISGLSDSNDTANAFSAGGADYITKPFQFEEVIARVETHLKIHNLQENLKDKTIELELKNKELENFSNIISHELRAPLNHISFLSHTLLEDSKAKINEKENIQNIITDCDLMSQMIDGIIKLSNLSSSELKYSEISLSKIVSDILKKLQTDDLYRKVEIIIKPDIIADADIDLIKIALFNLLSNAWKYTSKNPTSRIEFGMNEEKEKNIYFIKDDGMGFDMKFKEKLFKPFQTLHASKELEGNGIGLAIVNKIISLHKGEIWAKSEISKGAEFYFTLS